MLLRTSNRLFLQRNISFLNNKYNIKQYKKPLFHLTTCIGSFYIISKTSFNIWKASELQNNYNLGIQREFEIKELDKNWSIESVLNIIWEAIRQSPLLTLTNLITSILSALLPLLIPRTTSRFLDIANDNDKDISDLLQPTIELVVIALSTAFVSVLDYCLLTEFISRIHIKLSSKLFSCYLQQDISFFDSTETAELMSRLDNDVNNIVSTLKHSISSGMKNSLALIGGTTALFLTAPKLAFLMSISLPLMVGFGSIYTKYLRKLSKESRKEHTKVVGSAHESLALIRTVRAFAKEEYEQDKFEKAITKERSLASKLGRGIGILQGLSFLGVTGVMTLVLGFGGYLVTQGEMTAGIVTSFLFQSFQIQKNLMELAKLGGEYTRATSAIERLDLIFSLKPSISLSGGILLDSNTIDGCIEINNVKFNYPSRPSHHVLKNISLTIPPGKIYAIVGPSGSGKSTIVSLIERFYDVSSGSISIDGNDIRNLDSTWLRKQIGIVNQEPVLFDTSIIDNIRYGNPDASEEEVIQVCKQANCHNFISHFANGYQTQVGERGAQLSGGQKQRIAIARALLLNPKILILDEATSSLDAESEKLVQEALERVMKGRTVIVIAHRLSTIKNADCIVVLKDGKIVEKGTHEELINLGNIYANQVSSQMK